MQSIPSKIFLDSGDPVETQAILDLLGFLDGQTTNPSLVAQNPEVVRRRAAGERLTREMLHSLYQSSVQKISGIIPNGSVSIEVYADAMTAADDMLRQARVMYAWIPNAHIKFPITSAGLEAAERAVTEGMRVNMTLCFSETQAAAVYAATRGGTRGQVFLSPFVGRLDDRGENGMDLIANIMRLFKTGDGHVQVLAASIRSVAHLLAAMRLGADIITAPARMLREWSERGSPLSETDIHPNKNRLAPIPYQQSDLGRDWRELAIRHPLTDAGLQRFADDWNNLLG